MDPDPGKCIEVDPDPERGLKWIRIRPDAVDPDGSETLFLRQVIRGAIGSLSANHNFGRTEEQTDGEVASRPKT